MPVLGEKRMMFMEKDNFMRPFALQPDADNNYEMRLNEELLKECIEPCAMLIPVLNCEN